jgi:hypothetical protein
LLDEPAPESGAEPSINLSGFMLSSCSNLVNDIDDFEIERVAAQISDPAFRGQAMAALSKYNNRTWE